MSSVSRASKAEHSGLRKQKREVGSSEPKFSAKSVVAFTRYAAGSASSRVRIHQFAESIRKEGWAFEVHDFVNDKFMKSRYRGSTPFLAIPAVFLRRAANLIKSRQADLVWIQREALPWLPFWLEKLFLPNKPTVYDFDDAIHIQYLRHRSRLIRFLLGKKVAQIAKSADCIIVGNLELKHYMEQEGATDVVVIPSVIHQITDNRPKARRGSPPFVFCYTGNIYEKFQDPEPLFQALHALKEAGELQNNSVLVKFFGTRLNVAEKLAADKRYSEFIRIEGHVSREAALVAQREADILLLLENSNEESKGILTGKVFEYIVSGTPILCIGSRPEFELGQILSSTQVGMVIPPEEFQGLTTLLSASLRGGGLFEKYQPNFEEILRHSRRNQATELLDTIAESLKQRSKLFELPSK